MSTPPKSYSRHWDSARAWWRRQAAVRELMALPLDETERIIHDIGLSMSDMWALTRADCGPGVLLPTRLTSVGLNPASLERSQPTTFRDLQVSCSRCTNWRRCARDLANGDRQTSSPAYCLNSNLIDGLMAEQSRAAPARDNART